MTPIFLRRGQGRDTRCDKSLRHVTAAGCCNKSPCVTYENSCRCDRCDLSHLFKLIWIRATYRNDKISASSLVAPFVRICNKSLRQKLNQPMRKHQLVSRHVKVEAVYISSLPKLNTNTEQVSYRSDLSQDQCRRGDLSPRYVEAICCIVCLGLYSPVQYLMLMFHRSEIALMAKKSKELKLLGNEQCQWHLHT